MIKDWQNVETIEMNARGENKKKDELLLLVEIIPVLSFVVLITVIVQADISILLLWTLLLFFLGTCEIFMFTFYMIGVTWHFHKAYVEKYEDILKGSQSNQIQNSVSY